MNTPATTKPAAASKIATHVAVTLRRASRPAIVSVGQYVPDRVYSVAVAEAARLVRDKGFSFVTDGDRVACDEALAAAAKTNKSEG